MRDGGFGVGGLAVNWFSYAWSGALEKLVRRSGARFLFSFFIFHCKLRSRKSCLYDNGIMGVCYFYTKY